MVPAPLQHTSPSPLGLAVAAPILTSLPPISEDQVSFLFSKTTPVLQALASLPCGLPEVLPQLPPLFSVPSDFSFSSSPQLQMFSSCPHPKSQTKASFSLVAPGDYFYFPSPLAFLKGSLYSRSLTRFSYPL